MKIAVIGAGYVGLTIVCFADYGHNVTLIGRDQKKIDTLNSGICPIYEPGLDEILKKNIDAGRVRATVDYTTIQDADVAFICVGTPSNEDGSIDLSQIKTASEQIGEQLKQTKKYIVVIVKSTVVPGTTKDIMQPILEQKSGKKAGVDFGLCMNPEFLKEGTAVKDFIQGDKIVIGCVDDKSYAVIEKLYECLDKNIPRLKTDLNTAEMIKYAQNSMLANRISFMNEIANICERCEVDVKQVAHSIGLDKRIGPKFLNAGIGFGGSCFPKDVKALRALAKSKGVDSTMLHATLSINEQQPSRLIDLVNSTIKNLKNKKVAVLGLAFKSDTDDMRESRSIPIINTLLEQGATVKSYDPQAMTNAKEIFGDKIEYAANAEDCVSEADVCLVVTEWDEFKNIDFSKLRCPVIDGRRIIDPQKVKDAGLIYKGIGWKEN